MEQTFEQKVLNLGMIAVIIVALVWGILSIISQLNLYQKGYNEAERLWKPQYEATSQKLEGITNELCQAGLFQFCCATTTMKITVCSPEGERNCVPLFGGEWCTTNYCGDGTETELNQEVKLYVPD